jgi:hypothetical protein
MSSSPEAIRADEELLDRTLASTRLGYSIYAPPLLEGRILPQPTTHPDPRMSWTLEDMKACYNPPMAKRTRMPSLVTSRAHKTQAQTEAEESVK